ncbi:MAG: RHS repeat-associated core domain-containing protein, partial [Actinobacteria bacterium]|nr:RHS repeat-associated core domain-containing protein [Actinomycetota bacterium]
GTLSGTITGGTPTAYTYNGLDQLTNVGSTAYAYDPLGRTQYRNSITFHYSGHHNQPVNAGSTLISYTPGNTPLAGQQGANSYHLTNNNRHDITTTIAPSGSLGDTITYDPWGAIYNRTGTTNLPLGYQASYTDPTTALVNMGARWYSSSTMFVARDGYEGSVHSQPSLNRYSYAHQNPNRFFDPDGYCVRTPKPFVYSDGRACRQVKAKPIQRDACWPRCDGRLLNEDFLREFGSSRGGRIMTFFHDAVIAGYLTEAGVAHATVPGGITRECVYPGGKNDICSSGTIAQAKKYRETYFVAEVKHASLANRGSGRFQLSRTEVYARSQKVKTVRITPQTRNSNLGRGGPYFPGAGSYPTVLGINIEYEFQEPGLIFFYLYGYIHPKMSVQLIDSEMQRERRNWAGFLEYGSGVMVR